MERVTRYHPLLVALHWLAALMIVASLAGGLTLLQATPNSDPMKAFYLRGHMAGGVALATVMLVRLAVRLGADRPAPAATGWQGRTAAAVHALLYLLVFAMLATGLGMAALAGLWPLLSGAAVALPVDFAELPPHAGHALFARLLIGLVLLHVAAAFWHAVRGQPIWSRMAFGRRRAG